MSDSGSTASLTAVVRTTGDRPVLLAEVLDSLTRQSVAPDETIVVWHRVTASAEPEIPAGVKLVPVAPGGRGRPLNAGLEAATGDLVAFLDDDDLALPGWVNVFIDGARHAPGGIIRSVALDRPVERGADGTARSVGPDAVPEGRHDPFDYFTMLVRSRTPLCSVAFPTRRLREEGLRFSEELPVLEDWDFLLRSAPRLGVHDTGEVTSVYRRWTDGTASLDTEGEAIWAETRAEIVGRLDRDELVLPPGSASRLLALFEQERDAKRARAEADRQAQLAREVSREAKALERRIGQIESSTSWRLTAPLRRTLDAVRRRR